MEIRRFPVRMSAWGTPFNSGLSFLESLMTYLLCVPDQPGVKTHGRKYGDHHHRAEKNRSGTGMNGCQASQMHQGHQDGDHKNIDHRPAADNLDNAVEPGAVLLAPVGLALDADQQGYQSEQLQHRYEDTGQKDD